MICEHFTDQNFKTTKCTWKYPLSTNLLCERKKNHVTVPLLAHWLEAYSGIKIFHATIPLTSSAWDCWLRPISQEILKAMIISQGCQMPGELCSLNSHYLFPLCSYLGGGMVRGPVLTPPYVFCAHSKPTCLALGSTKTNFVFSSNYFFDIFCDIFDHKNCPSHLLFVKFWPSLLRIVLIKFNTKF